MSGLADTQLLVSATATGYKYGSAIATLDAADNTTHLPDLTLAPQTVAPTPVPTDGTQGTAPGSGESEDGTDLTINGFVSGSTPIEISAIPVHEVPAFPSSSAQVLVGSFEVEPDNTTFTSPITIKLPLPGTFPAGLQFSVMRMNSATDQWEPESSSVVTDGPVGANCSTVDIQISRGGLYGLIINEISASTILSRVVGQTNNSASMAAATNAAPIVAVTVPAPPAPVSLTSGSQTVAGFELWEKSVTKTGPVPPITQTFINNWITAASRSNTFGTLIKTTTVVVFPNLKKLKLADAAGRQIPPAGGVTPGRYTYTATFSYTPTVVTVSMKGGPSNKFPIAWSITATVTHTALSNSSTLKWGAFTGIN